MGKIPNLKCRLESFKFYITSQEYINSIEPRIKNNTEVFNLIY